MFISHIIVDFLDQVKTELPDYNYLTEEFYDPNLDFDNRLRSYLVKIDGTQLQGSEEDWIGICWNRQVITDAPELQDRQLTVAEKNLSTATGNLYKVKFAKVNFSIAYFSNSLDYMENFEEEHYITFNKLANKQVILPIFGKTDISYTELNLGDLQKLDRNEKGSIAELSFSFSAIFPIAKKIKDKQNVPLIGEALDPITGLPTGKPKMNVSLHFKIL